MIEEEKNFSSEPWYFAHIPKSGGTTFSTLFDRLFDVEEVFPYQLLWEIGHISPEICNKYQLFRGHFNAFGEQLAYRKTRNLTILRNPVEMAFSSYKHVCKDKNTKLHHVVVSENWSFEDFVLSPKSKNVVSNRMTKFLHLGSNVGFDFEAYYLREDTFGKFKKQIKVKQNRPKTQEKYELALSYLKRCFWVGVLDHFIDSIDLLCFKLRLPPVKQIPVMNKGLILPELSVSTIKYLEEVNQYDFKLYDWAKRKLEKDCLIMDTEISRPRKNGIELSYQNNYCQMYQKKLSDQIQLSMDKHMIGDQWFQREYDNIKQCYFRWSGPGNSSFVDFWLIPKSYAVEVHIVSHNLSDWSCLSISANNNAIPFTIIKSNLGWKLCTEIKRFMIFPNGLLRLNFTVKPSDSKESKMNCNSHSKERFALNKVVIK